MPQQKRIAGGWTLALMLVLVGCKHDVPPTEENENDGLLTPGPNEALLYYQREDDNYEGWGLHLWNDTAAGCDGLAEGVPTEWNSPRLADGVSDSYGAYYFIPLRDAGNCLNFIMHRGDDKDLGGQDHRWHLEELGNRIFTISGSATLSPDPITGDALAIEGAKAHWLDANTLVFADTEGAQRVELRYSPNANIRVDAEKLKLRGGEAIELVPTTLPENLADRFPHLIDWPAYTVDADLPTKQVAVTGQLVAAAYTQKSELFQATQVQIPGVLDDLFSFDGDLGATVDGNVVRFAVWAPTAQAMKLHLFRADGTLLDGYPVSMTQDKGVWRYEAPRSDVDRQFYQYEVTVYHPRTKAIETTMASDPYALSLSANSKYAQVVDLDDSDLQPTGWDTLTPPAVEAPEDIVVYETHIRDFSAADTSLAPELRGKYAAFAAPADGSIHSVGHLKGLADAGVTHLHLLPAFDIGTVKETPDAVVDIGDDFARLCERSQQAAADYPELCTSGNTIEEALQGMDPATGDAQALYQTFRSLDSFNWGYDPVHYTVPEGSYASDAQGTTRILEFRRMISALTDLGLNVVMDVVYNHTHASGLGELSVLDKLVPGYYHRQHPLTGAIENSTCCENTASEHRMMEKLMIDSLVTWTKDYRISGFRFDLMGHHMIRNMDAALAAVKAEDPDTYFYGEAWNFGEVANNARGVNAIQPNMAGTGIGSFNDRLRDAVRGGGPFDGGDALRANQGFANGLFTLPNDRNAGTDTERQRLLHLGDLIRLGIAGSLQEYSFATASGDLKTGAEIDYNGQPAGYTDDPQEIINYVSKHDNQTLWDNNHYKAPYDTTSRQRAQMQVVGLATPLLSQGIPFLHMGSELLRSKSMERDSYDSGDWFNVVDFSYQTTAWNRGLPRQDKDGDNWDLIGEVIQHFPSGPSPQDIAYTHEQVATLLSLRASSKLFRLESAQDVSDRLEFHNTGPDQIPGLIAFSLNDAPPLADLDPVREQLLVLINTSGQTQTLSPGVTGDFSVTLHTSPDASPSVSGTTFSVPPLSVAVFQK